MWLTFAGAAALVALDKSPTLLLDLASSSSLRKREDYHNLMLKLLVAQQSLGIKTDMIKLLLTAYCDQPELPE